MKLLPKSLKRRLWRYLTSRMNLRWRLRSGLTVEVKDYADWCTYNEIFANGEYDVAFEFLSRVKSPSGEIHLLDLGANTGFFALSAFERWLRVDGAPRIHYVGVEASPDTARDLESRLVQCKERAASVRVIAGLVGKKGGMGQLHIGRESNVNFAQEPVAQQDPAWSFTQGTVNVPWIDLDPLVQEWPAIDLLKCDIEGSEFTFIDTYSSLLARTKLLVMEFHHAFGNVDAACETLKKSGLLPVANVREADDVRVVVFRNDALDC